MSKNNSKDIPPTMITAEEATKALEAQARGKLKADASTISGRDKLNLEMQKYVHPRGSKFSSLSGKTANIDLAEYEKYVPRELMPLDDIQELNKMRAQNQSGWEQAGRALGNIFTDAATGIVGDVGHLISLGTEWGDDRDYSNALTKWADRNKSAFGDIYLENPDKVFDPFDFGSWMQQTSGFAAGLMQFGAETWALGAGFSSLGAKAAEAIGAASDASRIAKIGAEAEMGIGDAIRVGAEGVNEAEKGISGAKNVAKGLTDISADEAQANALKNISYTVGDDASGVIAPLRKVSKRATWAMKTAGQTIPRVANSAMLGYFMTAGEAGNVYTETYNKYKDELGEEKAKEAASKAAVYTARLGTIIQMGLNFGIVKPFYSKNLNSMAKAHGDLFRIFKQDAGESLSSFGERLKAVNPMKDASKFIKGNQLSSLAESAKGGLIFNVSPVLGRAGKTYGEAKAEGEDKTYWESIAEQFVNPDKHFINELIFNASMGLVGGITHKFVAERVVRMPEYKRDAEGKLIPRIDKEGNEIEGSGEKQWMTKYRRNVNARTKIFEQYRNAMIKDIDVIEKAQHDLGRIKEVGEKEAGITRKEVADKLFDVLSYNSVSLGATDNLIQTFKEVAQLDNSKPLTDKLYAEKKQIESQIESLKEKALTDPEVAKQVSQLHDKSKALDEEILNKQGHSEATWAGYASKPEFDNSYDKEIDGAYKKKSEDAVKKMVDLQKAYEYYVERFNHGKYGAIEYPSYLLEHRIEAMRYKENSATPDSYVKYKEEEINNADNPTQAALGFEYAELTNRASILEKLLEEETLSPIDRQVVVDEYFDVANKINNHPLVKEHERLNTEFNGLMDEVAKRDAPLRNKILEELKPLEEQYKQSDKRTKKSRELLKKINEKKLKAESLVNSLKIDNTKVTDESFERIRTEHKDLQLRAKRFIDDYNAHNKDVELFHYMDLDLQNELDKSVQNEYRYKGAEKELEHRQTLKGADEIVQQRTAIDNALKNIKKEFKRKNKHDKDKMNPKDADKITKDLEKEADKRANEEKEAEDKNEAKNKVKPDESKTSGKEKENSTVGQTKTSENAKETPPPTKENATPKTEEELKKDIKESDDSNKKTPEEVQAEVDNIGKINKVETNIEDVYSKNRALFDKLLGNKAADDVMTYIKDIAHFLKNQSTTKKVHADYMYDLQEVLGAALAGLNTIDIEGAAKSELAFHIAASALIAKLKPVYPEAKITGDDIQATAPIRNAREMLVQLVDGYTRLRAKIGDPFGTLTMPSLEHFLYPSKTAAELVEGLFNKLRDDGEGFASLSNEDRSSPNFIEMANKLTEIVIKKRLGDKDVIKEFHKVANFVLKTGKSWAELAKSAGGMKSYEDALKTADTLVNALSKIYKIESEYRGTPKEFRGYKVASDFRLFNETASDAINEGSNRATSYIPFERIDKIPGTAFEPKYKKVDALSIANQSREMNQKTGAESDRATALVKESRHLLKVGDNLTFRVLHDYEGDFVMYDDKGKVSRVSWKDAKRGKKKNSKWYRNHVPIEVLDANGNKLGYVHQLSYINKFRIADRKNNIATQRDRIKRLRKNIVDAGMTNAVMTKKSRGFLNRLSLEAPVSEYMSKALSEPNSLGVIEAGQIYTGLNKTAPMAAALTKKLGRRELQSLPVAIITAPNGELMYVNLNRLRLDGTYEKDLADHIDTDELAKKTNNVNTVFELMRAALNNKSIDGVPARTLMDNLVFKYKHSKTKGADDRRASQVSSDKVLLFSKAGKEISISEFKFQNQDTKIEIKSEKDLNEKEQEIKSLIAKMPYNVNKKAINTDTKIPYLDKDGKIATKEQAYNEFMADKLVTNVFAKKLRFNSDKIGENDINVYKDGDGLVEHIYTNNSVAAFDQVDVKPNERVNKPVTDNEIKEQVDKKSLLDADDDLNKLNVEEDLGFDSLTNSDNFNSIEEDMPQEAKNEMNKESKYHLDGISIKELSDLLDFGSGRAYKLIGVENNLSKADFFKAYFDSLRYQRDHIDKLLERKMTDYNRMKYNKARNIINKVLENKENAAKLQDLLDDHMSNLGFKTKQSTDDSTENARAMEDPLVLEQWNDGAKYSIEAKDTISFALKSYLASITMPRYLEGGKKSEMAALSSLGVSKKFEPNRILIDLLDYLHDTPGELEPMLAKLENSGRQDFEAVAKRLRGDTHNEAGKIRNSFVSAMKRALNVKYTLRLQDVGYSSSIRVFESNRGTFHKDIIDKWYANQVKLSRTSDVFNTDELGAITVNQDKLNDIAEAVDNIYIKVRKDEYDTIEELATEVIDKIFNPLGMHFEHNSVSKFLRDPKVYMRKLIPKADYEDFQTDVTSLFAPSGAFGTNVFYTMMENAIEKSSQIGEDGKTETVHTLELGNPLNTRSALRVFSELKFIEEDPNRNSVFVNGENNQESAYVIPSLLSDIESNFHTDGNKMNEWLNSSFASTNVWVNAMRGTPGYEYASNVKRAFKIVAADAMVTPYPRRAKTRKDMSPEEMEVYLINSFINNDSGFDGNKIALYNPLVFSDKKRNVLVYAPRFEQEVSNKNGMKMDMQDGKYLMTKLPKSARSIGHALRRLAHGEVKRYNHMKEFRDDRSLAEGQSPDYIEGSQLFFLFPEMNSKEFLDNHVVDGVIDLSVLDTQKAIDKIIKTHLLDEINSTIKRWYDNKIVRSDSYHRLYGVDDNYREKLNDYDNELNPAERLMNTEANAMKLGHLAFEFTANDMIATGSLTQLIADPALLYKGGNKLKGATYEQKIQHVRDTWDNYTKRLAGAVGTKLKRSATWTEQFGSKKAEANYKRIAYIVSTDAISRRYAKDYLKRYNQKGYSKVNVTDAQEFTTLKEHITNMYAYGKLSDDIYNSINQKIINSYKDGTPVVLSPEERVVIVAAKPLYQGHNFDVDSKTMYLDYVKSSSIPLIPEVTKGTELDAIRKKMEALEKESMYDANGKFIGTKDFRGSRVAFESAVKMSRRNVNNIFELKDGEDTYSLNKEALDNAKITEMNRDGFGIQQEESLHEGFKIYPVSQMNKLLFSGILDVKDFKAPDGTLKTGRELLKVKEALRVELMNRGRNRLYKKLGMKKNKDSGEYEYTDIKKLRNFILKKSKSMGLTRNEIEYLNIVDGKLALPLFLNNSYFKIISSLMSTVHKEILRPKISGRSYVQTSSVGFKTIKGTREAGNIAYTSKFDGESLKYTRYENGDIKSSQVLISRDYFNQLYDINDFIIEKDGKKYLDESRIDPELLKSIGARIPNQSHSSMLSIEVAGLLPEGMKDIVVVPDEITKQMGSDYDIDHLYNYLYNYKFVPGANSKPETSRDVLDKIEERKKEVDKRVSYDKSVKKELASIDRDNYDIHKARGTAANELGYRYSSDTEKFYKPSKQDKLVKITRDNTGDTKAAIENEYIDIHHSVLTHPDVVGKVLSPLDMADAEDFIKDNGIKEIVDKRFARGGVYNPLGMSQKISDFRGNMAGKDGVAIQSNYSMLMAVLGDHKLRPKEVNGSPFSISFTLDGKSKSFNLLGRGNYKNSKGEDRTNADTISAVQTESVDNSKHKRLAYLGYNQQFSGVYNVLSFLTNEKGEAIPLDFIASFMLQSPVQEMLKTIQNYNSITREGGEFKTDLDLIKTITDNYSKTNDKISLSKDMLIKALKGELSEANAAKVNSQVSKQFLRLYGLSKYFENIYPPLATESKGIGRDFNAVLKKTEAFNEYVLHNDRIDGVQDLVGYEGDEGQFVPTTELGHIVKNGLMGAWKLWGGNVEGNPMTVHTSKAFQDVSRRLKDMKGVISLKEQDYRKMERGMIDIILSDSDSPIFTSKNKRADLASMRQNLLIGEHNLFNRIDDYLKNPINKVGRILLESIGRKRQSNINEPAVLQYDTIKRTNIEEGFIIDSFSGLLNGNKVQKELGVDLLRYAVLSGWTFTPSGLSKLIPSLFVNKSNIGEYFRSIDLSNIDPDVYMRQLLQHNPDMATGHPKARFGKKNETGYLTVEYGKKELIKEYIKKSSDGELYLYEHVGTSGDKAVYIRIPTLGIKGSGFNEYDLNTPLANSSIPAQNFTHDISYFVTRGDIKDFTPLSQGSESEILSKDAGVPNSRQQHRVMQDYFGTEHATKDDIARATDKFSGGYKEINKFIDPLIKQIPNVDISIDRELKGRGWTSLDGSTIKINPDKFIGKTKEEINNEFEENLTHELIHSGMSSSVVKYMNGTLEKGSLHTRIKSLEDLMKKVRKNILDRGDATSAELKQVLDTKTGNNAKWQPLLNVAEFMVGATTNKEFLAEINNIEIDGERANSKLGRLLSKIFEALMASTGIDINKNSIAFKAFSDSMQLFNEVSYEGKREEIKAEKPNKNTGAKEYKVRGIRYTIDPTTKEVKTRSGNISNSKEVIKQMKHNLELDEANKDIHQYNGYEYDMRLNDEGKVIAVIDENGKEETGKRKEQIIKSYLGIDKEAPITTTTDKKIVAEKPKSNLREEGDDIRLRGKVEPKVDMSIESKNLRETPIYTEKGVNIVGKKGAIKSFESPFTAHNVKGKRGVFSAGQAVNAYYNWLRGDDHLYYDSNLNFKSTKDIRPKQREWILKQIDEGKLDGATLLFPKEALELKDAYTYADALKKFVKERRGIEGFDSLSNSDEVDKDVERRKKEWGLDPLNLDHRGEKDTQFYRDYGLINGKGEVRVFNSFYEALKRLRTTEKLIKKEGKKDMVTMFKPYVDGEYQYALSRAHTTKATNSLLRDKVTVKSAIDSILKSKNSKVTQEIRDKAKLVKKFLPEEEVKLIITTDSQFYKFSNPRSEANNDKIGIEQGHYDTEKNRVVVKATSDMHSFLHEAFHAITAREFRKNEELNNKWKGYYERVLKHLESEGVKKDDWYGLSDHEEFLSELMSNPNFADFLSEFDAVDNGKSLFHEIIDKIIELISPNAKSLEKEAMGNALSVLELSRQSFEDTPYIKTNRTERSFLKAHGSGDKNAYMKFMNQEGDYSEEQYQGDLLKHIC